LQTLNEALTSGDTEKAKEAFHAQVRQPFAHLVAYLSQYSPACIGSFHAEFFISAE